MDPDIYAGEVSDVVAFTCAKADDGKAASGGGNGGPGGGGGGGDAQWTVKPKTTSFDEGTESFKFVIGEHSFLNTTAELQKTPADGDVYTYKLAKGDAGAPFDSEMILHLMEDGTARVTVAAAGPMSAADVKGTWSVDGGVITVTFK